MDSNCDRTKACGSTCEGSCTDNMCVPMDENSFRSESGVPLVAAGIGKGGKIVRVSGRSDIRRYLCELGFVIGEQVAVVNENTGSVIIEVKGSRIAMDRSIASKIFVAPT